MSSRHWQRSQSQRSHEPGTAIGEPQPGYMGFKSMSPTGLFALSRYSVSSPNGPLRPARELELEAAVTPDGQIDACEWIGWGRNCVSPLVADHCSCCPCDRVAGKIWFGRDGRTPPAIGRKGHQKAMAIRPSLGVPGHRRWNLLRTQAGLLGGDPARVITIRWI